MDAQHERDLLQWIISEIKSIPAYATLNPSDPTLDLKKLLHSGEVLCQ